MHYEQARPDLRIATSGDYRALPLTLAGGTDTSYGIHPSASGLHELWNSAHMAVVHACGLSTVLTRSHFDAQLYVDVGVTGRSPGTGWMGRALTTHSMPGTLPALAVGAGMPMSMAGTDSAISLSRPSDFSLNTAAWGWQRTRENSPAGLRGVAETMAALWAGPTALEHDGRRADQALQVIARQPYSPTPASWPTSTFAQELWTVAQSIRFGLGLRYASVDLGGWDTHNGQGTAGAGYHHYQNVVADLSSGLAAFWNELAASGHAGRVTVVVQSEFGRRIQQNGSGGTDHGYGNPMLVLGGSIAGRKFFGTPANLDPAALVDTFGDVPVTTDYRQVLSELLRHRMGHSNPSLVFPGFNNPGALGIVRGVQAAGAMPAAESLAPRQAEPASEGGGGIDDLLEAWLESLRRWIARAF